jgi:hypothetical protein
MPSERKLDVSLSMKIKGESTSVKVLPWDPFATLNVAGVIYYFVHIGCAFYGELNLVQGMFTAYRKRLFPVFATKNSSTNQKRAKYEPMNANDK